MDVLQSILSEKGSFDGEKIRNAEIVLMVRYQRLTASSLANRVLIGGPRPVRCEFRRYCRI